MKSIWTLLIAGTVFLFSTQMPANAHCQIPGGIYNDAVRITLMQEHITTIEKSMKQINELENGTNPNQLVRWVTNKDAHADKLMEIVTAYFMTQRIKPVAEADTEEFKVYQQRITILHRMLVAAMKAKQTTDLSYCKQLRELITAFEKVYPIEHEH